MIRLAKRWADRGLPSCPIDSAALALGHGGDDGGFLTLSAAAVRA